jgi:hypothetical protein
VVDKTSKSGPKAVSTIAPEDPQFTKAFRDELRKVLLSESTLYLPDGSTTTRPFLEDYAYNGDAIDQAAEQLEVRLTAPGGQIVTLVIDVPRLARVLEDSMIRHPGVPPDQDLASYTSALVKETLSTRDPSENRLVIGP